MSSAAESAKAWCPFFQAGICALLDMRKGELNPLCKCLRDDKCVYLTHVVLKGRKS